MKIRFVRDCPPIPASGNENYRAGTEADLRRGKWLVDNGYAESMETKPQPEPEPEPLHEQPDDGDMGNLEDMSMADLREIAAQVGAETARSKADLIANIEAARGE